MPRREHVRVLAHNRHRSWLALVVGGGEAILLPGPLPAEAFVDGRNLRLEAIIRPAGGAGAGALGRRSPRCLVASADEEPVADNRADEDAEEERDREAADGHLLRLPVVHDLRHGHERPVRCWAGAVDETFGAAGFFVLGPADVAAGVLLSLRVLELVHEHDAPDHAVVVRVAAVVVHQLVFRVKVLLLHQLLAHLAALLIFSDGLALAFRFLLRVFFLYFLLFERRDGFCPRRTLVEDVGGGWCSCRRQRLVALGEQVSCWAHLLAGVDLESVILEIVFHLLYRVRFLGSVALSGPDLPRIGLRLDGQSERLGGLDNACATELATGKDSEKQRPPRHSC
mmetsp:Transcript_7799/g.18848  ORF Transcript_7799/g.18848 Transcript_7799/m.18848 type:complete len:340 (-) Transcript_7799:289-1308(-)